MESHLLGPRAVQPPVPSDHPRGEPRGVLPGASGGAGERRRFQHRAAQHRRSQLQMIIGRLVPDLCPMSTHRHNPMRISCPRPPSRRGRGDETKRSRNQNFQLSTKLIKGKFQFSTQNQIKFRSSNFQNDQNLSARFSKISRSVREKKKEDV